MSDPQPVTPQPEPPGFVPAIILRNKGVPVTLFRLENDTLPEVEDGDDQPTRTWHVRFTANDIAEIEDAFDGVVFEVPIIERTVVRDGSGNPLEGPSGYVYDEKVTGREERRFYGLQGFQASLEHRPSRTVRKVLSILMGKPQEVVGLALDPTRSIEYQNAVGVAWSIAQGVDPSDAAKTLARVNAAVVDAKKGLASELEKTMDQALGSTTVSPGPDGSEAGPRPVDQ